MASNAKIPSPRLRGEGQDEGSVSRHALFHLLQESLHVEPPWPLILTFSPFAETQMERRNSVIHSHNRSASLYGRLMFSPVWAFQRRRNTSHSASSRLVKMGSFSIASGAARRAGISPS